MPSKRSHYAVLVRGVLYTTLWSLLTSAPAVRAQSLVEARFVLRDLQTWFSGTFDNEPQRYLDAAFGEGQDGPHPWQHWTVAPIDDNTLGEVVIHSVVLRPDEPQRPATHWFYAFDVDETMKAVRMRRFVVHSDYTGDHAANPSELAAAATEVEANCPIWWRQGPAGSIYGSMPDVWCSANDDHPAMRRSDWVLSDGALTVYEATRDTATQSHAAGRLDEVPMRFTRALHYECFINIKHTDGSGSTFINPFSMHDAGGRFRFATEETTPRQFEVTLRRSMWPSRSGRNFVPLLAMWVFEDGQPDDAVAAVWSAAQSGRVGWDFGAFGGGRCKIP